MTIENPEAFRPGVGIQGTAPVEYKIQWTGTEQGLIEFAAHVAELYKFVDTPDSDDLGDSMGVFIQVLTIMGELHIETEAGTFDGIRVDDLFKWEGVPR